MLISRAGIVIRRLLAEPRKQSKNIISNGSVRHSSHHWAYRKSSTVTSTKGIYLAEFVGGFMWWWILWHLWHEPEHLTGEFAYPDPSKWTDQELGIPPDDEE
ncbi:NADH dehydrogenase [ubiquinone] 1 beta subcomplex subunit 2, mitochondrial-like [Ischnura elegans]|uniref:NADH dehydrogenase [ubiquinone] 1 beta subcomplex subunit 2, mitochondrial-like n=1 Tax=Ischnura elegans TaxID=197161 RepID=UPI001ED8A49F|nr:NADH dehydrogenase [ubiquinone] 1 beta subcomplex subunit 2, mitochondrial-like [Ischnura elegans]